LVNEAKEVMNQLVPPPSPELETFRDKAEYLVQALRESPKDLKEKVRLSLTASAFAVSAMDLVDNLETAHIPDGYLDGFSQDARRFLIGSLVKTLGELAVETLEKK